MRLRRTSNIQVPLGLYTQPQVSGATWLRSLCAAHGARRTKGKVTCRQAAVRSSTNRLSGIDSSDAETTRGAG